MNEFDFIREVLSPLAGEGAFGLTDDAALIRPGAEGLVVTADMLVEGRHFRSDCPAETVAKKALRANLSDLAAKGARPVSYTLSVGWPERLKESWRRDFVCGLKADQKHFGVSLIGGDTTATDGPLTVSITAFGAPGPRGMVRRKGARAGDSVFVTGTIGDAGLGLRILEGELSEKGDAAAALVSAYRTPVPAVGFAGAVAEHASAAIDVSDGVLADAAHIAKQSGAMLKLDLTRLPLSKAGRGWLEAQPDRDAALSALATSGDDYQILFTAWPEEVGALGAAARAAGLKLTRIGEVCAGHGLRVRGETGEIWPETLGFTHF